MRKLTFCMMTVFLLAPVMAQGETDGYYSYSFSRMSYVKGEVYVQRTSDLGYEKGEVNLALVEGDKLGTTEGQAEIHFGRRNYLRLDENTQVEFVSLPREGDDRIKLHLLSGNIFLRVSDLGGEKNIEVHTPDASYYVLDEGLYRFDVTRDGQTELFVHEGSIEAAGESGSLLVEARQKLSASNGDLISEPSAFYAGFDGFDRWNESRDGLLARKSYNSYLPSEINEYEDELADNGRWAYEEPYGNVWVPRVYDSDWRPYYYGRWVWYPVIGWNWISSEPWGWCTSHYGRWHWRLGLGWYWIPTSVWGPAWVHWYNDYNYVGWCPLSWYNRPGVILNNRFYDRYNDWNYPMHSRALTMIHRNQLQSPDVHRHALGRDALRSIDRVSLSARQPDIRPSVNRSGLQQGNASRALSRTGGRQVGAGYAAGRGEITSGQLRRSGTGSLQRSAQGYGSSGQGTIQRRSLGTQSGERSPGTLSRGRSVITERGSRETGSRISTQSRAIRRNSDSQSGTSGTRSSASGRQGSVTRRDPGSEGREYRSNSTSSIRDRIQSFSSRSGSSSSPSRRSDSGYGQGLRSSRSTSSQIRSNSSSAVREFRSQGALPSSRSFSQGYSRSSGSTVGGSFRSRSSAGSSGSYSPSVFRRSGASSSYSPGISSRSRSSDSPRTYSSNSYRNSNTSIYKSPGSSYSPRSYNYSSRSGNSSSSSYNFSSRSSGPSSRSLNSSRSSSPSSYRSPGVSSRSYSSGSSGSSRSYSSPSRNSGGSPSHSSGSSGGVRRRN